MDTNSPCEATTAQNRGTGIDGLTPCMDVLVCLWNNADTRYLTILIELPYDWMDMYADFGLGGRWC
ncbi:hypothetical protein KSX_41550 [Ktedonospora formicarum]|uniref:Uncharacterized protein n=1 Tax=Ktedonospora formicarum TaxID=2778364 RepID=A0A8J3HXI4_9CHLR|nr:hypothetical protein KSX_41550 [Ktedonospora formicarum]